MSQNEIIQALKENEHVRKYNWLNACCIAEALELMELISQLIGTVPKYSWKLYTPIGDILARFGFRPNKPLYLFIHGDWFNVWEGDMEFLTLLIFQLKRKRGEGILLIRQLDWGEFRGGL